MKIEVEHRYERISCEAFVKMYFSVAYNNAIAPIVSLKERRIDSEVHLENGRTERRIFMAPDVALPSVLAKMAAHASIAYTEVSVYDPQTYTVKYHIESAAQKMISVSGQVMFIADSTAVRRRIQGDVHVKILGLGHVIERLIASETQKRYDAVHVFTQDYIDSHQMRDQMP